jgi:hypothetical protein
MSETPRADKLRFEVTDDAGNRVGVVHVDVARQLERELLSMRKANATHADKWAQAEAELTRRARR